jgi:hypothetical protein
MIDGALPQGVVPDEIVQELRREVINENEANRQRYAEEERLKREEQGTKVAEVSGNIVTRLLVSIKDGFAEGRMDHHTSELEKELMLKTKTLGVQSVASVVNMLQIYSCAGGAVDKAWWDDYLGLDADQKVLIARSIHRVEKLGHERVTQVMYDHQEALTDIETEMQEVRKQPVEDLA